MNSKPKFSPVFFLLAAFLPILLASPGVSHAQDFELRPGEKPVEISANFYVKKDTREGVISVTAEVHPLWHVFSVSQKKGGPLPTKIKITESDEFKVAGPFAPNSPPHVKQTPDFEVPVEEHLGAVTWSAPIEISDGISPEGITIKIRLTGQTCENKIGGVCQRVSESLTAEFDGYVESLNLIKTEQLPVHDQPVQESVTEKEPERVLRDSPELVAEMAKLYDAEEKVSYLVYDEMDKNPIGSGGTSSGSNTTFMTALIGAFLGGMLLNLMPCVFPVLGLKVMGFVMQAGSEPRKIRMHGIAFAFGLLVSMWVLAGIIMTIRNSFGHDINWGAQMGNPYFVGSIIVLLFLLGLNMAGVFEIGTSLSSVGGGQKKGYSGSFFSGILTTLIATPCSGPFLGVAMSYTMAQPTGIAMFLFTIFGLGIAAPYLVLSFFPALIKLLPKPGPWMETFKVVMAFALFATVAFFMQAFGGQTGVAGLSWLIMALVVIGLAAYFYGRWSEADFSFGKKAMLGYALPAVIAGVGGYMAYDATTQRQEIQTSSHSIGGLNWEKWNPGKIEHSLANKKKIIWVDYTADW